jgi:hypothetical protein
VAAIFLLVKRKRLVSLLFTLARTWHLLKERALKESTHKHTHTHTHTHPIMSGRRGGGGRGGTRSNGGGGGGGGGGGRGDPGGGRGRGRLAPGMRPVEEHVRISISDQLADFQRGEEKGEKMERGREREEKRCIDDQGRHFFSLVKPALIFFFLISTEIKFPPGLSNHDRAVVHAECRKYGFKSKSHG